MNSSNQEMFSLTIKAELKNLKRILESLRIETIRLGLDPKTIGRIELVSEEALVNIINHAYAGTSGDLNLTCFINSQNIFTIEIEDEGPNFSILNLPDPDTSAGLLERKPGGLGVYLIKKLTSNVSHTRVGNRNILRLEF